MFIYSYRTQIRKVEEDYRIRLKNLLAIPRRQDDALRLMGDKSPKATNKQAAQKQAKVSSNSKKKGDAAAAKQVVKGKK